jgi:hypothetical protein
METGSREALLAGRLLLLLWEWWRCRVWTVATLEARFLAALGMTAV